MTRDQGSQLTVCFVYELAHRPAGYGTLDYDVAWQKWISCHPDPCIQRMAECYLQSYLMRRIPSMAAGSTPSGAT